MNYKLQAEYMLILAASLFLAAWWIMIELVDNHTHQCEDSMAPAAE